jgi:hypothetical protein
VVFVVAGAAKLADRAGSRKALADFGVPSSLATPLATLLPLAELAVAAALIPAASAWWGALGALALLLLFVAGISINLARGRKPDCHCFGQLHSAPAGWRTLARNGALAAIAGFVLWAGYEGSAGPSAISWLGALSAAQLLGLLGGVLVLSLLAGQWWFLVHLLRQNGRILVRLEAVEATLAEGGSVVGPSQNGTPFNQAEGLPVGSAAPEFTLWALRRDSHPRSPALFGQAADDALHRPRLRPLQRDVAGCRPLARGTRQQAEPFASEPGIGGGEQDQGSRARS